MIKDLHEVFSKTVREWLQLVRTSDITGGYMQEITTD